MRGGGGQGHQKYCRELRMNAAAVDARIAATRIASLAAGTNGAWRQLLCRDKRAKLVAFAQTYVDPDADPDMADGADEADDARSQLETFLLDRLDRGCFKNNKNVLYDAASGAIADIPGLKRERGRFIIHGNYAVFDL
jgi:hypothetical protein